MQEKISIVPDSRWFLLDLNAAHSGKTHLLASACGALLKKQTDRQINFTVEGVGETPGIMLLELIKPPRAVTLDGKNLPAVEYSAKEQLMWIHFENKAQPQELSVQY